MKKSITRVTRKLALRQETLRALTTLHLTEARGGAIGTQDELQGCPFIAVAVASAPAALCA